MVAGGSGGVRTVYMRLEGVLWRSRRVMVMRMRYSVSAWRSRKSNSSWGVAIRSFGGAKIWSSQEFGSVSLEKSEC